MPKISLVCNFYNSGKFIPALIETVLAQDFEDWELVAVDDCSPGNDLAILKRYPESDAKLLLVRMGTMEQDLKDLTEKSGLKEHVIFGGGVSNPEEFYSAFDCMLLPSLYEGFDFVAVEAQAAGLRVIASNNNTKHINITVAVSFCDINTPASWLEKIIDCNNKYNRGIIQNKLIGTPFDSAKLKLVMEDVYFANEE